MVMSAITFMVSSIFLVSKSPQILTFSLVALTLSLALLIFLFKITPWFSFLLFLVFLGGMLIMFSYIVSLSGDDRILEYKSLPLPLICVVGFMAILTNFSPHEFDTHQPSMPLYTYEEVVLDLFSSLGVWMYVFLFVYLLLTLLFSAQMLKNFSAPLRPVS